MDNKERLIANILTPKMGLGSKPLTTESIRYCAPEYLAAESVTERGDLYSLGMIMYFLFTGYPPFLETRMRELRKKQVHPVNGEVPPVKGRPWKLPHYANRGKTTSSGGELASARSCFSTVRTALGKLRITGLLAQFDVARSFPQFPRPLLLQPTILTSERGTRFGIRKAPNHVPTSPFTG